MMILVLSLAALFAAVIAAGIAVTVRYSTGRNRLAIAIGGLALPTLIAIMLLVWLANMGADDAPPGAVIGGGLLLVAATTPTGILASFLTVRLAARRSRSA